MTKLNFKKSVLCLFICLSLFLSTTACSSAQKSSTDGKEVNKININDILLSWSKDSQTKAMLENYIYDVTDEKSSNFIPKEDRIAVFDVDGTLYSEASYHSLDVGVLIYHVFKDPTYNADDKIKADTMTIAQAEDNGTYTKDVDKILINTSAKVYKGLTSAQYANIVNNFLQSDVEGFSNLKFKDSLFKPMLEVIKYLQANDFKVFLVSGSTRGAIRVLFESIPDIPKYNIIGRDYLMDINNRTDKDDTSYLFKKGDEIIRDDTLINYCWHIDKVFTIEREIGQKPVLAFGNGSGDYSMINYTTLDNKYKSLAFVVNADDPEREGGQEDGSKSLVEKARESSWNIISTKKDFSAIFLSDAQKLS